MGSRLFIYFLIVFSALTAPAEAQERENNRFYVDLQKYPLFFKVGFNHSDAVSPDLQDGSWQVKEQWYGAVIRRLGLPEIPKRIFLWPWGKPEREWTFAVPFTMDAPLSDDEMPVIPCLYLASIGINWEIYLNGTPIKKEMHMANGRITEQHYERDVIVPINSNLLQKGRNILVFRIVGDPTDYTTGFTYKSPYYISEYDYVMRKNNETAKIILISILAILGIYHFLFFAIFRENRYSLACGFFTLEMSLYYLLRTHWIHQLIPNTAVVVKLEYFTVYFIILALMVYTDSLCNGLYSKKRYSIITKIYGVFCSILAVTNLLFSRTYGSEAAAVWQIVSVIALVWIYIHNIIFPFTRELKKGKKFTDTLVNTYPGNLLFAVTIVILTGAFDLINSLAFHYSLALTSYGMVVFALSITFMLFRMSVLKNRELKEKSALLESAANPASMREKVFVSFGLTEREREIARLMVEGLDNKDIGERLFVSSSTIAFHVTNIFRKFGIIDGKNKGRAVFLAKLLN
ncbi:MAG: helix-turn-helix transcriptional regulator [Treponema sp.]|jgi:DNA-binding CsgD family transcriptional regulator|nr:helix-turn-helix transcriptional regulator [Treponema sp.]